MYSWIAQMASESVGPGTRLYIQEAMYSPVEPRPLYAVGDRFGLGQFNGPEKPGMIVDVQPTEMTIQLQDGTRFRLAPTPSNYPPPALRSPIPFEDWIVV